MSEKQYVLPKRALRAFIEAMPEHWFNVDPDGHILAPAFEALAMSLSENPIVPDVEQAREIIKYLDPVGVDLWDDSMWCGFVSKCAVEWQHRCFLAPEQENDPDPEKTRFREALEKLAKLGNGDAYGNSIGNTIAQEALGMDKRTPVPLKEDLADRIFKAVGPLGYTPTHAELDKIWEHIFRAGHGWVPPELRNRGDEFGEKMNRLTVEVNRLGMEAAIEILQRTS